MLYLLFVCNELSSETWVLRAHKTCSKVLQGLQVLASIWFVVIALVYFFLSCFYLLPYVWFVDFTCIYDYLFIFLFFLILFYLFIFLFYFFLSYIFTYFSYIFVLIICYLDLSQTFYCHGISIFYLDLSALVCLGSYCIMCNSIVVLIIWVFRQWH